MEAIPTPTGKKGVREFLEMAMQLKSWTHRLSMGPKILRAKKNNPFQWNEDIQAEFNKVKEGVASTNLLSLYNRALSFASVHWY